MFGEIFVPKNGMAVKIRNKNVAKLILGNATFKKWQPRQHENVSPNKIKEKYLIALN
jgi:hypothetical protein